MERLRPIDIEKTILPNSFRGYDRAATDDLKARCSREIETLLGELRACREEVEKLRGEVDRFRAQENTLKEALVLAQKAADDTRASANKEADLILEKVRQEASELRRDLEAKLTDTRWELERARLEKQQFITTFRSTLEDYLRKLTEPDLG